MERRALRRAAALAAAVFLFAAIIAVASVMRNRRDIARRPPPDVGVPATRVRVQVLNATSIRGLARRATMHLRDRGFDVVEIGTTSEQLDSTLVLDRSGRPGAASRVADALGGARVESRPDSSRYLDITVLLGRTWRPPAQPFYP